MGLYDYTIYSIIRKNALLYNNRIALVCKNRKLSHRQLLEKVEHLACGLVNTGVEKGDRIAILAQNTLEYVWLYGAAARIGAIVLPINWRLKPEEIEYIIYDGSPKIIFVGYEFKSLIKVMIPKFGFVEKYYTIGQRERDFEAFDDLLENDGMCPDADVSSDDAYLLMYTTAIGGRPQGVVISHQGIIASSMQSIYFYHLTNEDINLLILPVFHIFGLGSALSIMQAGGSNIIVPKFDVDLVLKHVQEDRVTTFAEVPPMLKKILNKAQEGEYDLSSIRIVTGFDDRETIKEFEEMTGGSFWSVYGQTETSGVISYAPYFRKPGSVGVPGFMVEVEIMDDYGNILEIGKTGEIVVHGPMVFKGYWNLEKENEYTFRDGWHHTGDIGRFDVEGYLWYKGRTQAKELIKPGGENVYPAEVEKVIMQHHLVEEATVIGVPDPQWGEAIKAVCVLKKGSVVTETELIEFVAARIARFKKPKHVVFVAHLPKTKEGLTDRAKIKEDYGKI